MKLIWQCADCGQWFEGINYSNPMSAPLCPSCVSNRWSRGWHHLCDYLESHPKAKSDFNSVVSGVNVTSLLYAGRELKVG